MRKTTSMNIRELVYACIAGFCLFAIAMGIDRFSYTPIIPFLINSHWVTMPQAGYVGSANFLGYFISAYAAHKLTRYFNINKIIIMALSVSVIATALCLFNLGYIWLSIWRLIVGFIAGIIMVLTPTIILAEIPHKRKAIVSGIIFSGIGIGIAGTSILIPVFNLWGGLVGIWISLSVLTLMLSLIASVKCYNARNNKMEAHSALFKLNNNQRKIFFFAIVGYALYAIGLTPSLLFLSDYAHRVLHANLRLSSVLFALLGIGCAVGSLLGGWLHNKLGNYWSIIITSCVGVISFALLVFIHSLTSVAISAFLTGFYLIALVVLMSLFVGDLAGMHRHAQFWSHMTLVSAGSQFIAGYIFSYALSLHIVYLDIFGVGLFVLILSLISYSFLRVGTSSDGIRN